MGKRTDVAGLSVTTVLQPGHTVLRLVGEIDLAEVDALRRAAHLAVAAGRDVLVDLGGVTFVDACGLAAIVGVRRVAHAAGLRCHLVHPSRPVRRVAGLTRSENALGWDLPARGRSTGPGRGRPSADHARRRPPTTRR
ncbi:STAS domain-containing protein [Nocardioides sp. NPDC092400]|uniref:STAS domain-containing protein n=1 Tax=Nocardioides sp. NPDC092400 TaxID=3155196 RepID=UPI00343426AB